MYRSVTADKAVEVVSTIPEPRPEYKPEPKPEKPVYPRTYQTIVQAGQFRTIVWLEIGPGKYKSFESDEAADKYNPETDDRKDERKPGGSPAGN